jgi:murein DD-endopeptidase MepM/ murein hydrolase activator NlpD
MKKGTKKNNLRASPKLTRKYKLILRDADSYEEKFSFILTRLGVIVTSATVIILLIVATIYLVAFTSLREYIPGYTDLTLPERIYQLRSRADSLDDVLRMQNAYLQNLRRVLIGDELENEDYAMYEPYIFSDTLRLRHSEADSLLRLVYERETQFNLYPSSLFTYSPANIGNINFFTPITGMISRHYDPAKSHFGVDIVANHYEPVKAILDGTVIFSDWTLETGYIVCLQHQHHLISVYKHNSNLLKNQGELVKAGETISFVGESGELTTGPHLHFELWYNGNPVNPEEYISF